MSAEQLTRDEVVAFLSGQPGAPQDPEPLTGGAWSSAWAYRAGGEDLVVRFGREVSWYEADRMAVAFSGPDLPVPEVREVGVTPSGRAYAISVRHHGRFLEDTPSGGQVPSLPLSPGCSSPCTARRRPRMPRLSGIRAARPPGAGESFCSLAWLTTLGNWSMDGAPP